MPKISDQECLEQILKQASLENLRKLHDSLPYLTTLLEVEKPPLLKIKLLIEHLSLPNQESPSRASQSIGR